jgi:hypothetical protein
MLKINSFFVHGSGIDSTFNRNSYVFYFFISNQKSTFLCVNLLPLEPFSPLNGVTYEALPQWEAHLFSLIYDCDDDEEEVGGTNGFGKGNRSSRRKPAPTPLCPPQIPLSRPGPPRWGASD